MEDTIHLVNRWLELKEEEKEAQRNRKAIEKCLELLHADEIASQLDADYGVGTASIKLANGNIKLSYPKKVTWDNEQLANLWNRIEESGENPSEFIERSHTVAEAKYKHLPSSYRVHFESARTVKAGNPTFQIDIEA